MDGSWWRVLTKRGPLEKGMVNHQYSCLENPMNSMKRQKDRTLKDELPRSVGAQYATEIDGELTPERMNRQSQSKQQHPVVNVTGDGSKVQCCKEQNCMETWNVRSMLLLLLSHFSRVWLCTTP